MSHILADDSANGNLMATLLAPLQVNPLTGEPFLRLNLTGIHVILTPPRLSDPDYIVPILNDSRVNRNLLSTPIPYTKGDGVEWITRARDKAYKVIEQMKAGQQYVDTCPAHILREVTESGEEIYVGDCSIGLSRFFEIGDAQERERKLQENASKELGDPSIEWIFGDFLAPSHHGRGIMTAAVASVIDFATVRMAAQTITATPYHGNIASVRVFEKNGFRLEETIPDVLQLPANRGGGKAGLHVLRWRSSQTKPMLI